MLVSEILGYVSNMRKASEIKLFLKVYLEGAISKSELGVEFNISDADLDLILTRFNNATEPLAHYRIDQDGKRFIVASERLYAVKTRRCATCVAMVKLPNGFCGNETCKNTWYRNRFKLVKMMMKSTKKCEVSKNAKSVNPKSEERKELREHFEKRFMMSFPGEKYQRTGSYIADLSETLYAIKLITGDKDYLQVTKDYLSSCVAEANTSREVSFKRIKNNWNITKFINKINSGKKIIKRSFCHDKGINCPYRKGAICELEQDGVTCDDEMVAKIEARRI